MATSDKNIRVFADANILFSGAAFPRWPYEVLQHAISGDFQLVLCPLVISQARRNLQKRFPQHIHRLEEILQLTNYELIADPTPEEVAANLNFVRDLSDVPVALAAIASKADCLVSEDKDLTVNDKTTDELRRHLKVKLTGSFLREVMDWTSEQLEEIRHRNWSDMAKLKDEE